MLHGVEAEGAARNGVTHGSRHLLDLECLHQAQDLDELSLALFAHEVADGAPGHIRLATIQDFSAASLHGFVAANLAQGATIKTDGWAAYPGAPNVAHDPHVVGNMAAHIVLPWIHRVFSNLPDLKHAYDSVLLFEATIARMRRAAR